MKKPTAASLKRVNPENLAALGAERLAEILAGVAATRPELKRRLRMELAAEQGAEHLAAEVDKRLGSLAVSKSRVSWRQRATFVRDLEGLRGLIAGRLAGLDRAGARDRMLLFLGTGRAVSSRVRDRDGSLARVYARAAEDLGALLDPTAAASLADAVAAWPTGWAEWLPAVLAKAPPDLAADVLAVLAGRREAAPGWVTVLRRLAEAAGDLDALIATYPDAQRKQPEIAAELAGKLLAAGRVAEAGKLLKAAAPAKGIWGKREPDVDWESAWIDWLEASGKAEEAQAVRWAAFERTLSAERARAFTKRLPDFEDVEAEHRAFAHAAAHPDFPRALQFLMDWPALPEAAAMIMARADEVRVDEAAAERWAAKLRPRHPTAAHLLLRRAAAQAFRRRDFATCDRLTHEADSIAL